MGYTTSGWKGNMFNDHKGYENPELKKAAEEKPCDRNIK